MKYILTIFFIATFFCASAQTKNTSAKAMTAQDSAAALQQEYNKFMVSLSDTATIKYFIDFLINRVTVKFYNEGTWLALYDYFLQTKGNEWLQKRNNKSIRPKN